MWLARLQLFAAAATVGMVAFLLASATASAQQGECGGARVVIEGGEPSPFVLPSRAGDTLNVGPHSVLLIRAENLSSGSTLRWGVRGLGGYIPTFTHELGPVAARVDIADYSSYARGLYEMESTLFTGPDEVCTVAFRVNLTGFGGVAAIAAATLAGVLGALTLASIPLAASGMNAKLKLKVQVQRRRPRGWRRFIPVPAWKRTIFSTLTGALSGLCVAVVLQQGGFVPLSLATGIWSMIIGGGVTLGVGYSLGALLAFLRPAQDVSR